MFGFANRYKLDHLANGVINGISNGDNSGMHHHPAASDDDDHLDDIAYERKARLCNIRKRSIEIPLENLLSGIVFLSGGRDSRGAPLLSIVQPDGIDIELLMELRQEDILDMLSYYTSVPSEEVRSRKFSVVIASESMYDFFLRNIILSLIKFQIQNDLFHCVYVLNGRNTQTDIFEWAYVTSGEFSGDDKSLKHHSLENREELYKVVSRDQLTSEFGGTLNYSHQDWVRFRMQVEPFICDVVGVSKRLAEAIAPFMKDEMPETIKDAEESLKQHHLQRRQTLESLHVEDLASEGEKIRQRMNSPSKELLHNNPDFTATLDTIELLMNRVENVRSRLDNLWHTRNDKLEAKLKQKKFEQEAGQILEWFEQYAEEFFETHTEIGESLEVAQALVSELLEFETNTKQILKKTNYLLRSAEELKSIEHFGGDINEVAVKVRSQLMEFQNKMEDRKKRLNNAVELHNIMENSINWCIEGVEFLSTYDILSMDPSDIDPEHIRSKLDEFQSQYPPPKKSDIKLMSDAVSSMDSHWGKEGFEIALNRIVELNDRFGLYYKLLDEIQSQKSSKVARLSQRPLSIGSEPISDSPVPSSPISIVVSKSPLRRISSSGKEVHVSVLDVEKRAQQALNLLDKTGDKVEHIGTEDDEGNCNSSDSDCMSLLEFLSEVHDSDSPPTSGNNLEVANTRVRSYSAPEDMTDGGGTIKRSHSFGRRATAGVKIQQQQQQQRPISPKPQISRPTNAQFEENNEEDISLDDTTVDDDVEDVKVENPEVLTSQTANARHRRKLMEEFLTTEEAYIKDLEYIISQYIPLFEDDTKLPPSLIGTKDILFCMLPEFLEFSRDIVLPRIRKCVRAPIKMGLVFLDYEEEFLKYAMYFKNKPQQDELIASNDEFFRKIQEQIGDMMLINASLIKPVQRVTKYKQFLEQMIKFSTKGKELEEVQKGAKKEYFSKLKEAMKMIDFVLRHGNDLLALECLKGFNEDVQKLGRILRVGDVIVVDGFTKHKRKIFLFEKTLLFAKTRKNTRAGPSGSEVYDYKQKFQTTELTLREQIPGQDTRFALETRNRKESIMIQTETVGEKQEWIQEIWDLFFSHMLSLRDDNLENYGTAPITNVMVKGSATLTRGRPLSHSMRKRIHTISSNRKSLEMKPSTSRESISSVGSATSLKELAEYIRNKRDSRNFPPPYSPGGISPRSSMAISFNNDRTKRDSAMSYLSVSTWSSEATTPRSSIVESPSSDTISSNDTTVTTDPEGTLTRNLQPLKSQESTELSLDESLKIYSTPM